VVGHLAHELRQPLSAVESISYYLRMVVPRQDERTRQQLEKLEQLVDQMNWILSDAVNYLQAAAVCRQPIDLAEGITEAIKESGLDPALFRITVTDGPLVVRMDPGQARHLMRSLYVWFDQITRGKSAIHVHACTAGGTARLEVGAPGFAVSLDQMERMFEPFHPQAPAGSGLAMASARRIVENAGGRMEAHSEPLRGLRVIISLPPA